MLELDGIENIIFDLGGVLLDLNYPRMYAGFQKCGMTQMPDTHQLGLFHNYEKGAISTDHFIDGLKKIAGPDATEKGLSDAWNSLLDDFPDVRFELLNKLKDKYRIFLLSNINELHVTGFETLFKNKFGGKDPKELFEKKYYSNEVKMRKPEPEIFSLVLNENNLNPGKTLFIDDTLEHILSARNLNIQAFHLNLKSGMRTENLFQEPLT